VARCNSHDIVAGSEGSSIMAITPFYNWVMPAPTDLVTDLPADFEIFGDAVDASVSDNEIAAIMGAL
jgi:hypothetical protein